MINKTIVLLVILGLVFLFCVVMMVLDNIKSGRQPAVNILAEQFADTPEEVAAIQKQLDGLTDEQLKGVVSYMKDKLVGYNLLPEQVGQVDTSQWVPKSNIPPPGPRVDLSQYMKKSSCPPEKVCPPQKEIDYSQYVKRSTIPPQQVCPPCVAPKVKVSAAMCKKCPDCPPPPPCPTCPTMECPEPKPCPKVECPKCSEIKYIKVPTIITRTIKLDAENNVVSEEVSNNDAENSSNNSSNNNTKSSNTKSSSDNNSASNNTTTKEEEPSTTKPLLTNTYTIPAATRAANKQANEQCNVVGLNSEFRKYGVYGLE